MNAFTPIRGLSTFPRTQSRAMANATWETKLKPLRPTWPDITAGAITIVILALAVVFA